MGEKRICPNKTEAERAAAKRAMGSDCCCCFKDRFQPWHGSRCPHGMP